MNVLKIGLECIGCGLCEDVCPKGAIKIIEHKRAGLLPKVDSDKCIECNLCAELCLVSKLARPDDLSLIKGVFEGSSRVPELYLRGSSGGIVSSILHHLFDEGKIDAALVAFYDNNLNLHGDFITSKEEITKHSGSYYQTCKQLLNINKITTFKSVAVVGLPCHIEALKNYVEKYDAKNITFTISLFCTIGRMREGLNYFLKAKFNLDLSEVNALRYISRYGKKRLPGNIVIETPTETLNYTCIEYLDYVDFFYTPVGCFNCRKLFGLSADISVGDNWGVKTDEKIAIVTANTEKGISLINEVEILKLKPIKDGKEVLLRSQPNGTAIKVYRSKATKTTLYIIKYFGLMFQHSLLRKVANLIRSVLLSYVRYRANRYLKTRRG